MSNRSVALYVLVGATVCGAIVVIAILVRPEDSFSSIDTIPIKTGLIFAALSLVFFGSAIFYGIFHLPSTRKFCVVMGATTVGTAMTSCIGYGAAALGSARLKYAANNGNMSADIAINFDAGSAASYAMGMLALGIVAAALSVLGYAMIEHYDDERKRRMIALK